MKRQLLTPVMILCGLLVLAACSTTPETEEDKADFHQQVVAAMEDFRQADAGMDELFRTARGYAVFPNVGKGGLIVGGASGRGEVYENGQLIGYARLTQGTVGLQAGGQAYSEVIFFENATALNTFKDGKFALAAQASAVIATAGASADADYENGVLVFTLPRGGAMAEASVGGQAFDFDPIQ